MQRSYRHPIYGGPRPKNKCCELALQALNGLNTFLESLEDIVFEMFKPSEVTTQVIGQATARATMSDTMAVLYAWRVRNPGVYFDKNNLIQQYDLKNLYITLTGKEAPENLFTRKGDQEAINTV